MRLLKQFSATNQVVQVIARAHCQITVAQNYVRLVAAEWRTDEWNRCHYSNQAKNAPDPRPRAERPKRSLTSREGRVGGGWRSLAEAYRRIWRSAEGRRRGRGSRGGRSWNPSSQPLPARLPAATARPATSGRKSEAGATGIGGRAARRKEACCCHQPPPSLYASFRPVPKAIFFFFFCKANKLIQSR